MIRSTSALAFVVFTAVLVAIGDAAYATPGQPEPKPPPAQIPTEGAAVPDDPKTPAKAEPTAPVPPPSNDASGRSDFRRRLASLKQKFAPFTVRMAPDDDPTAPPSGAPPTGPVQVAGRRLGIFTPPVLSPEDVQLIVQGHMADVRRCYKRQLRRDPEWRDELILDIAIKRNGRVSEVGVAPRRVRRAVIGRCLMRTVPRWRFPRFTGEVGDGITQEVLNASFPFEFGPR